jgi:hypothetical protein
MAFRAGRHHEGSDSLRPRATKSSMASANKVFLDFSTISPPQMNRYRRIRALALKQLRLYTAISKSGLTPVSLNV